MCQSCWELIFKVVAVSHSGHTVENWKSVTFSKMIYIVFNSDIRSILHVGSLLIFGLSASRAVNPLWKGLPGDIWQVDIYIDALVPPQLTLNTLNLKGGRRIIQTRYLHNCLTSSFTFSLLLEWNGKNICQAKLGSSPCSATLAVWSWVCDLISLSPIVLIANTRYLPIR